MGAAQLSAMDRHATASSGDLRTIETYVRWSIHWGVPAVAVLVVPLAFFRASQEGSVLGALVYSVVTVAALVSGLALFHTALRDHELLEGAQFDVLRLRPAAVPAARATWLITSALSAVGQATVAQPVVLPGLVAGLVGSLVSIPLIMDGRTRVRRWPAHLATAAYVAVACSTVPLAPQSGDESPDLLIPSMMVGLLLGSGILVSVQMLMNLLRITRELERARRDSARLAVTEERLRFARDLHDVFGRTLSAVALKAELGAEQAERGRPEAGAVTMREVRLIATEALDEVRSVVRGYREIDLNSEIRGARTVLEAAGITVTTVTTDAELPAAVRRTLAWTVREAATNVIRHADATTVSIRLVRDRHGTSLSVTNDGARQTTDAAGTGLAGLRERLAEIGGEIEVHTDAEVSEFTLRALVDDRRLQELAQAERETQT